MKLIDFLNEEAISTDLKSSKKVGVVEELVDLLITAGELKSGDRKELVKVLLEREKVGSTGIGGGIAIPHGKTDSFGKMVIALGCSKKGIDFDALDKELVHLFFLLVAPSEAAGVYLKALARISRLLKGKPFREALKTANTKEEIVKVIKDEDLKRH